MKYAAYLIVVTLLIGSQPGAQAATARNAVTVDEDVVRVGDIFLDAGDRADDVALKAPRPGRRDVLAAHQLAAIAAMHGLDWRPTKRRMRTVIRRASRRITAVEVEKEIAALMAEKSTAARNRAVRLSNRRMIFHAATTAAAPFAVRNVRHDARTGRITAEVLVASSETRSDRMTVTGRSVDIASVPVLARPVRPGEILGNADLDWVDVETSSLARNAVLDASDIVGRTPRRPIRPGQPVAFSDLRMPVVVSKGALVTLYLQTPHMVLTAKATAAEDGSMGQTIRVVNVRSRKTVEGIIVGPGQLRIVAPWEAASAVSQRTVNGRK